MCRITKVAALLLSTHGVADELSPKMNPAHSRAVVIETDQELPSTADVVVIGGGILGVSAAYFLARRGNDVTLCEKGVVACESSSRAHGQVASAGMGLEKMELLVESKQIWGELSDTLGPDLGYRKNGYTAPFFSAEEEEFWGGWFEDIKQYEPEASMISAAQAQELSGIGDGPTGAYHNPTDGCGEPPSSTSILARAARELGIKIIEKCAVRGLDYEAGCISKVITEKGTIRTDTVVLAGGSWSMLFAGSIGVDLPMLNVHATCQSIAPLKGGPGGTGDLPDVSWRREADGGYSLGVIGVTIPVVPSMLRIGTRFIPTFRELGHHWQVKYSLDGQFIEELFTPSKWSVDKPSPFEQTRIHVPKKTEQSYIQDARDKIVNYFPAFKDMKVREEWSGVIVTTPDNMPTISPVRKIPGLHLLTGFNYGFTMGPGAGKLMADIITGDKPSIDPGPYRYERYIDGTRLKVVS